MLMMDPARTYLEDGGPKPQKMEKNKEFTTWYKVWLTNHADFEDNEDHLKRKTALYKVWSFIRNKGGEKDIANGLNSLSYHKVIRRFEFALMWWTLDLPMEYSADCTRKLRPLKLSSRCKTWRGYKLQFIYDQSALKNTGLVQDEELMWALALDIENLYGYQAEAAMAYITNNLTTQCLNTAQALFQKETTKRRQDVTKTMTGINEQGERLPVLYTEIIRSAGSQKP